MSDAELKAALAALANLAPSSSVSTSATSYILGIDYVDWHYSGSSFTWYGSAICSSSRSYTQATMPSGWNDVISSAVNYPYSNCGNWYHYQHSYFNQNQSGSLIDCGYSTPGCYEMGIMSNRTSSEKWTV